MKRLRLKAKEQPQKISKQRPMIVNKVVINNNSDEDRLTETMAFRMMSQTRKDLNGIAKVNRTTTSKVIQTFVEYALAHYEDDEQARIEMRLH